MPGKSVEELSMLREFSKRRISRSLEFVERLERLASNRCLTSHAYLSALRLILWAR
jgi:hypothetical protein